MHCIHIQTHFNDFWKVALCSLVVGAQVDCVWNVMAHALKPDFVFRRNGRVHLNLPGGVSSVNYWQPRCAHQRY